MAWLVDYVSKIQIGSALALIGCVDINTYQSIKAKQQYINEQIKINTALGKRSISYGLISFHLIELYYIIRDVILWYSRVINCYLLRHTQVLTHICKEIHMLRHVFFLSLLLWRFWVLLIRRMDWACCSPMTPYDVYRSGSTMVQVIACYLTALSQYWTNVDYHQRSQHLHGAIYSEKMMYQSSG